MPPKTDKTVPTLVMGLLMVAGYVYSQGRHRFDPVSEDFVFEKHQATRHLVDMHKRVDRESLEAWLAAEQQQKQQEQKQQGSGVGAEKVEKEK
jgi:hypothetical protein